MATAAVGAVIRRFHAAAAQPPRLTNLALHPPKFVEVEFADGSSFHLLAEFLRVYSPAADSKIRSVGGEKVIFGRRHVGIMSAESVGNYGVRDLYLGLLAPSGLQQVQSDAKLYKKFEKAWPSSGSPKKEMMGQ